jgi:hypothetical protein
VLSYGLEKPILTDEQKAEVAAAKRDSVLTSRRTYDQVELKVIPNKPLLDSVSGSPPQSPVVQKGS